jgi:hypothetical protein
MNSASSPEPNPEETEVKSPFQPHLSAEEEIPEETEWHSPFETHLPDTIKEAITVFGEPDPIFPDPVVEGFEQGGYGDTCAIRCQEVILHQYGIDVDENTLVHQAIVEHLYYPGQATLPQDVGQLLVDYGIPVHQYQHASIFNLTVELAQGHMVMIGVNSSELHRPLLDHIADILHVGTADHAVIVSGIDTHDPDHVQVIVSDPSTGDAAARYPLESFVNAWEDSDFFVTATEEPPPQVLYVPEMEHFDYDSGHIAEIAGIPYDEFEGYADSPTDVAHVLDAYLEPHEEHDTDDLGDGDDSDDTHDVDDAHDLGDIDDANDHDDDDDHDAADDLVGGDDSLDTADIGDIGF